MTIVHRKQALRPLVHDKGLGVITLAEERGCREANGFRMTNLTIDDPLADECDPEEDEELEEGCSPRFWR